MQEFEYHLPEDVSSKLEHLLNNVFTTENCQLIEDEMLEDMIEEELGYMEVGGFRKNAPKSKDPAKVVKSKSNKRDKSKLREQKRSWNDV